MAWWFYLLIAFPFLSFLVPWAIATFVLKEQDLKRKYNAKWAVVTGASSGIGRAISEKLAAQGINIVLVALDDPLLPQVKDELTKQYPALQFRSVPVNLSKEGYMEPILKATDDIDVSLLFNNAGYVTIGFFADLTIDRQMGNIECNMLAGVRLTHHFVNRLLAKKMRGAVVFTSSPAGQMPTPFSVVYGATKSFVTAFGASLAPELYWEGIDVQVIHPSPVDTAFYRSDTAHKSSNLVAFAKTAVSPRVIAEHVFKTVGRMGVITEQGYFVSMRFLFHIMDAGFLAWMAQLGGRFAPEYKALKADAKKAK